MLGILIKAALLIALIRAFTDDDVEWWKVILASFISTFVQKALTVFALAPIESVWLGLAVGLAIAFIVSAVTIQLLCSADVKTVCKIAASYIGIEVLFAIFALGFVGFLNK